jgi:hypothetical protein
MSSVSFVTAFIDIYLGGIGNKTIYWRFQHFKDIVETGIKICVYTTEKEYNLLKDFIIKYDNVKIIKISLNDLQPYNDCKNIKYSLPEYRNKTKDTLEYLSLMQSKIVFLHHATMENYWNTTHFAWIDFSISYIFKNKKQTLQKLIHISNITFNKNNIIVIPGCNNKLNANDTQLIKNNIYWRFCGGFLLGERNSIIKMHDFYKKYFLFFLEQTKKVVWEVNFWAWLEANTEWSPIWYAANHDDSIFNIPLHICT